MAIVQNFWLKGASKRLAGAVIYEAMGQTRARQLASSVTNPRTESQMNQRVKWANLVNFYRANQSWMRYAFETKARNQSEYNKFMSINLTSSNIYLTKTEAANGACICAPYIITQGSLPSIEISSFNDEFQSNLYLSTATSMDANVPVSTLTRDLLDNNPALREGDQISFIRITQQANGDSGVPYIIVRKYEMLLDLQEQRPWTDFWPQDVIGASTSGTKDLIAVFGNGASGGFSFVLSRTISGKTYVSSQRLTMVNNQSYISQYSSDFQLSEAIRSYGEQEDAFLSTVSVNTNSQASVFNSLLSVRLGSLNHVAGSRWEGLTVDPGATLTLMYSSPVETIPTVVRLETNKRSIDLANLSVSNGMVYGDFPAGSVAMEGEVVWSVKSMIDGTIYQIQFQAKNADTQEGME